MSDIGKTIKDEIRRLAKSEAKIATDPLKTAISHLRKTVRDLEKKNQELEKQLHRLPSAADSPPARGGAGKSRYTSQTVYAQRQRLGLNQTQFANLVGASLASVVNWEAGRSRPRQGVIERILATRTLGRRDVKQLLGKKKKR